MTLPDGYSERLATPDDAEAVLAVIVAVDLDELGEVDYELEDVRDDWARPRFDLATDSLLVLDEREEIIGYAVVWNREGGFDLEMEQYVHPAHQRRGIEEHLVAWSERRATEIAAAAAPEQRAVVTTYLLPTSPANHVALLRERGYEIERVFLRMGIDLTGWAGPTATAAGVSIRAFDEERDARAVHATDQEAFADHYRSTVVSFEEFAQHHMHAEGYDPGLWLVAEDDATGEMAGVLLGFPHLRGGWIRDLGVRRQWRGRGVGLALLERSFEVFRERGATWVGLSVDAENATGATRLYERAGMQVEHQIDVHRKRLAIT